MVDLFFFANEAENRPQTSYKFVIPGRPVAVGVVVVVVGSNHLAIPVGNIIVTIAGRGLVLVLTVPASISLTKLLGGETHSAAGWEVVVVVETIAGNGGLSLLVSVVEGRCRRGSGWGQVQEYCIVVQLKCAENENR